MKPFPMPGRVPQDSGQKMRSFTLEMETLRYLSSLSPLRKFSRRGGYGSDRLQEIDRREWLPNVLEGSANLIDSFIESPPVGSLGPRTGEVCLQVE